MNLSLDATPDNAYRFYFLLEGVTGTSPGFPLPGGKTLPLNWDIFTGLVFKLANTPVFSAFHGMLNGAGQSAAQLNTSGPLPPNSAGITMYFAFLLYQPYEFVSNHVEIDIVP